MRPYNTKQTSLFIGETGVRPRLLCQARPHLGLQAHLWCLKNNSNPWMGSNTALSVPSYEGERLQDQLAVIILLKNMQTSVS